MRSKQSIFIEVVQRLAAQGVHSADSNGVHCLMRASNTVRDPVGWLIPDRVWSSRLEGLSLKNRHLRSALQYAGIPSECLPLIADLQRVHDEEIVGEWPFALLSVADKHGLSADVVMPAFRC